MELKDNKIYIGGISVEELVKMYGSPLYVYDKNIITQKIKMLKDSLKEIDKLKLYYALKANSNIHLINIFKENGIGIDAGSPEEVELALKLGFKKEDVVFTGNNLTNDELQNVFNSGIKMTLDSLSQLENFGKILKDAKHKEKLNISIRINPDVGGSQHPEAITGGPKSKFGIYFDKIEEALKIAKKYNFTIDGILSHIGSSILDVDLFLLAFNMVLETAEKIPNLKQIDFGGGFGVKYSPKDKSMDFDLLGKEINGVWNDFCKDYGSKPLLSFEPGRFFIAEAGFLLANVTSLSATPNYEFVGINTGFNHLIRPMAYGSYHPIYNGSNLGADGSIKSVVIAGNLCESIDIFTVNGKEPDPRDFPAFKVGDVVVVANTGAYGYSMSSNYNFRRRPAEVLVDNKGSKIIRKRETIEDLLRGQ